MSDAGYADVAELATIGSTQHVALLVQLESLGDPRQCYRWYVRTSGEPREQECLGQQNTGDPSTLCDFILWGNVGLPG